MGSNWIRPRSLFYQIFHGLLFGLVLCMYLPNLKLAALPVPEIIGGTQNIGQSLDTPALPLLQNFSWAFVRINPVNVPAKFESRRQIPRSTPQNVFLLQCKFNPTRSSATAEKQRVSCPHGGRVGLDPPAPPLRPLWLYLCVWLNPKATTYVRQACRP